MNILLILLFSGFICHGCSSKSPLTSVDPADVVKDHSSRLLWTRDKSYQDYQESLQNLPRKLLEYSEQIMPNTSCSKSLEKFLNITGITDLKALKMLDSWGKPESGILEGNFLWEGRYFECISSNDGQGVFGRYCDVSLKLLNNMSPTGSTIAICVPDVCSAQNITALLELLPVKAVTGVNCISSDRNSWEAKDVLGMIILCLFGALVTASTLFDYATSCKVKESVILDDSNNKMEPPAPIRQSTGRRALLSFSVIRNTKLLLDTTQRPTDITCLHGMRFLSMSWVILGHSFLFPLTYSDNIFFLAQYTVNHYEFQALTNAFFSVDSFFFLSGLLVVYLGLRQLKRREGRMNVPMMYLHRYLRLTPPYAFLILISISVYPKFAEGPFWPAASQSLIVPCQKYWYTNLLYFNNLYPASLEKECWAWGWYLANDTQFYLLVPLFLWFLYRYPKVGLGLVSFVLSSSIIITGAFSAHTKQQPTAMLYGLMAKEASNLSLAVAPPAPTNQTSYSPYISDLYAKPWCRIGAYLVGMITGYILYASNNKVKMNKVVVIIGWVCATILNFELVYCCYSYYSNGVGFSNNVAAFYNAMSRPMWCVGLAWVVIACVSGYGGPVNTLLSWKAFIPLSRLTYCSYLIHPLVIDWFVGAVEVQHHYSIYFIVMLYLFALVLTTIFAFVVAMLVEFPFIQLLKLLQRDTRRYEAAPPKDENDDQNPLISSS